MQRKTVGQNVKSRKRGVRKTRSVIEFADRSESIPGSAVTVFDEDGEWTGMMLMNNPMPHKTTVIWVESPEDNISRI